VSIGNTTLVGFGSIEETFDEIATGLVVEEGQVEIIFYICLTEQQDSIEDMLT
jgi:hypothetical protein